MAISKLLAASIFFCAYLLKAATFEEVNCHSVNGYLKCHETCETCSQCNNSKTCMSCFPGDFKISEFYDDELFACSSTCENLSKGIRFKKYRYCSVFLPTPAINESMEFETINYSMPISENIYLIIILVIAAVVIVFCCIIMAVFFSMMYFIKKNTQSASHGNDKRDVESLLDSHKRDIKPVINQPNKVMIYNNLEIVNTGNYEFGEVIGGGSFSRVYEGKLDGQNVAIKMALKEGRKSIHIELQIYDKVSHTNILPALGIHLGVENLLFMPLRRFNLADYFIDYGATIHGDKLLRYCIQISSAVKYLHENETLHCDIKIDNILVKDDEGEEVELSDFGCAIDLSHNRESRYSGTITHTAYELLKDYINPEIKAKGSKASDVWAFAVTLWQIYSKTGRIPNDFLAPREIINNYEKGKKLPKPVEIPERLWRYMILQCFDLQPSGRPTMKEIYEKLTTRDF